MQASDFIRLLGTNPEVHQATGMVSVQIEDSLDAAAACLLDAAEVRRCTPNCVAAEVVARRVRFAPHT